MKKKMSIIVAFVLIVVMSVSTAMASYYSDGSIVLPGGTVTAHNEVYNNKKDAYAKTNGQTNSYISVSITGYYIYTPTGHTYETQPQSGSLSGVYIRRDAPSRGSDEYYYKIKSVHTGSIADDYGSITLVTTP